MQRNSLPSTTVGSEGNTLTANGKQTIEIVIHNNTNLDGRELARGITTHVTEIQDRDDYINREFKGG